MFKFSKEYVMLDRIKGFRKIQEDTKNWFIIVKTMENLSYGSIKGMNSGVSFLKAKLFPVYNIVFLEKGIDSFMDDTKPE